jgi:multiple sugar transport system permease protein
MSLVDPVAGDSKIWKSLTNTVLYTVVTVPSGMVLALSLALLLNVPVRGRVFFRTAFYIPSITPRSPRPSCGSGC